MSKSMKNGGGNEVSLLVPVLRRQRGVRQLRNGDFTDGIITTPTMEEYLRLLQQSQTNNTRRSRSRSRQQGGKSRRRRTIKKM
jgi:hypothetical protein